MKIKFTATEIKHRYDEKSENDWQVQVFVDGSFRIFGTVTDRRPTDVKFDKIFKVGDACKVGSYNLVYMGDIIKATAKTVSCSEDYRDGKRRFGWYEFIRMNWNFDLDKACNHNANELHYI